MLSGSDIVTANGRRIPSLIEHQAYDAIHFSAETEPIAIVTTLNRQDADTRERNPFHSTATATSPRASSPVAFAGASCPVVTSVGVCAATAEFSCIGPVAIPLFCAFVVQWQTPQRWPAHGLESILHSFTKTGFPYKPIAVRTAIIKGFFRLEIRKVGRQFRQHSLLAPFGRSRLFPYLVAYPRGDPLQRPTAPAPLVLWKSIGFKLIVCRILHSTQELVPLRVFEYAKRYEVPKNRKTNQVALLRSNQHTCRAHEPDFTRQSLRNSYPQPAMPKIRVLLLNWIAVRLRHFPERPRLLKRGVILVSGVVGTARIVA